MKVKLDEITIGNIVNRNGEMITLTIKDMDWVRLFNENYTPVELDEYRLKDMGFEYVPNQANRIIYYHSKLGCHITKVNNGWSFDLTTEVIVNDTHKLENLLKFLKNDKD